MAVHVKSGEEIGIARIRSRRAARRDSRGELGAPWSAWEGPPYLSQCTQGFEIPDSHLHWKRGATSSGIGYRMAYAPNGSILVVDDNADALRAMSELLQFEGFSVLTAQNGLEALNKMRTADRIFLVLLDLWMPVMDGWEVLRRKARDAGIAEIPVVVVSAIAPASLDGVEATLKKPISPQSLVELVRRFGRAL